MFYKIFSRHTRVKYKNQEYDFFKGKKTLEEHGLILIEGNLSNAYVFYICKKEDEESIQEGNYHKAIATAVFHKLPKTWKLKSLGVKDPYRRIGIATYLVCLGLKRAYEYGIRKDILVNDQSHIPGLYTKYTFGKRYCIKDIH